MHNYSSTAPETVDQEVCGPIADDFETATGILPLVGEDRRRKTDLPQTDAQAGRDAAGTGSNRNQAGKEVLADLGQVVVKPGWVKGMLERLDRFEATLDRLEAMTALLVQQRTVKDWYTTEEVAKILGKAEFTVREWCRNGRVKAEKRMSGRGAFSTWVISHQELLRYQREGLLPTLRLS